LNTFPARPPSLLYRLPHCKKELFTDSGAGTLIRRGYKLFKYDSIDKIGADRFRQVVHDRDPEVLAGLQSVTGVLEKDPVNSLW
jgi:hypothetical protein